MNTKSPNKATHPQPQITSMSYNGPLPPAQQFGGYEDVLPGAANRILILTEQEQQHRFNKDGLIAQENIKLINNDHMQKMSGVIVGGILSMTLIISGLIMVLKGHDGAGGTIVTSTLVGLAGVFVYSKKNNKS